VIPGFETLGIDLSGAREVIAGLLNAQGGAA
jgi:hypothetical protein